MKLVVLILLVAIFFLPLVSMVVTSLKTMEELFKIPPWSSRWPDGELRDGVDHGPVRPLPRELLIISFFYTLPCILGSCFPATPFPVST